MKRKKRWTLYVMFLLFCFFFGCGSPEKAETIKIVHKNYTEQRLVGQMLSLYLESKGYKTEVSELGGSMLCFNALCNGEADLYAEYTGTAYMAILGETKILSEEETYGFVKKVFDDQYEIIWLDPLGWNNTYVLSVTSQTALERGLKKTSDLIGDSENMVIGCDSEFANRTDGYPGLLEAYPGLSFKKLVTMDQGLTYDALKNGDLDVNVSFSTDGRIAKFDLVNLIDDASFFPPYYCVPIVKKACIEQNPKIGDYLTELKNAWSEEDMQKYNLRVDEGEDLKTVAESMLQDAGFLK